MSPTTVSRNVARFVRNIATCPDVDCDHAACGDALIVTECVRVGSETITRKRTAAVCKLTACHTGSHYGDSLDGDGITLDWERTQ